MIITFHWRDLTETIIICLLNGRSIHICGTCTCHNILTYEFFLLYHIGWGGGEREREIKTEIKFLNEYPLNIAMSSIQASIFNIFYNFLPS